MKIGLFYQSSERFISAYYVLEQFRKIYPISPIALYEDNSDVLKPIGKKFGCIYNRIEKKYENYEKRPFQSRGVSVDVSSTLLWFDRLYEACTTTLKDIDWIIHMEDDVWFVREFKEEPKYDLNGITAVGWNDSLYHYLNTDVRGTFGSGGAVFNRIKFIESYYKLKDVDWDLIDNLAVQPKPSEWADIALTFLFLNGGMKVGYWDEIVNYKSFNEHSYYSRDAYVFDSLNKQGDVAIVHTWKMYYHPTEEEINYVKEKINETNN